MPSKEERAETAAEVRDVIVQSGICVPVSPPELAAATVAMLVCRHLGVPDHYAALVVQRALAFLPPG